MSYKTQIEKIKKTALKPAYCLYQLIASTKIYAGHTKDLMFVDFSKIQEEIDLERVQDFVFSFTIPEWETFRKEHVLDVLDIEYTAINGKKYLYVDYRQILELIEKGTPRGSLVRCGSQYLPKEEADAIQSEKKARHKQQADDRERAIKNFEKQQKELDA